MGIRETAYFDGLEGVILDWFLNEAEIEIRQCLMEHMIKQSSECASYEQMVLDIYEKEPVGSAMRERMQVVAAGTRMYSKLRSAVAPDLFDKGVSNVTNNTTYNISGGVQGGAVSIGGDATNLGNARFDNETTIRIQTELSKLERDLHEFSLDDQIKTKLMDVVQIAKAEPTLANVKSVTTRIREAGEVVLAGTTIWEIGSLIAKLAGF
jgi:hypothetical protein